MMFFKEEFLNAPDIKITCWDINKQNTNDRFWQDTMNITPAKKFDPITKKHIGFGLIWKCIIHTPKGFYLKCKAEDVYSIEDVSTLKLNQMAFVIDRSLKAFESAINKKLTLEEREPPIILLYVLTEGQVADILLQLVY